MHSGSPTSFQIATLIVAAVGASGGLAALMWNVLSWRMTGARVRVEVRYGVVSGAGIVAGPLDQREKLAEQMARNGAAGQLGYFFVVRNRGRSPATVMGCSFATTNGFTAYPPGPLPGTDRLPGRLETGEVATFGYSAQVVEAFLSVTREHSGDLALGVYGVVELGDGRSIKTSPLGI